MATTVDTSAAAGTTAIAPAASSELPKIKLYWLEQSRSQRILWLLEELKLPYELEIFHRNKQTLLAPPELKRVHALGKSPVLTVTPAGASSESETVTLAESAFIIEYLLDHFAPQGSTLLPQRYRAGQEGQIRGETEEWRRFRYFMHYAEGSLMGLMVTALIFMTVKAQTPFIVKPIVSVIVSKVHEQWLDPNFKTHFDFLESQLASAPGGGGYLCGPHLTGADILLSFPLIAGKDRAGLTPQRYPKLAAYVARLEDEPGYKVAVEKIVKLDGKFVKGFD